MGWTGGQLQGPFSARPAIEFDLGAEFAARVIATVRYGRVIYAAVRSREEQGVFALVLLTERHDGLLHTKAISEEEGPAEDRCPQRILELLSEPSNEYARHWRERCRARIARPSPCEGQVVVFAKELLLANGARHSRFTYEGGSRFQSSDGVRCRISNWQELEFEVEP